ncbi:MAG TPA: acyltransferase [Flavitalea sp.]|nr:acyltransferase [Flavitalea sp.]
MANILTPDQSVSSLSYKPRLDGLRCLAVGSVMLFHYIFWLGVPLSTGYYGVNLFFVLSGFLITTILIKDKKESFGSRYKNFLGRRALRIFPIYYLTLLVMYICNAPHIHERIGYLASYTYNFIIPQIVWLKDAFAHYWSLCVEEQFYLIFPILAIALRNRLKTLFIICGFIVLVAYTQLFFDIFNMQAHVKNKLYFDLTSLLTHMAPLSIGAMGAIISKTKKLPAFLLSRKLEILAIIVIVATCYFLHWKIQNVICSFLNLFLILKAFHFQFSIRRFDKLMTHPYVVYFGRISYGLYIYHQLISAYLDEFVIDPLWLKIPFEKFGFLSKLEFHPWFFKSFLYTFLTIIIASYSYFKIEMPILKLKDKLFGEKKRQKKLVVTA